MRSRSNGVRDARAGFQRNGHIQSRHVRLAARRSPVLRRRHGGRAKKTTTTTRRIEEKKSAFIYVYVYASGTRSFGLVQRDDARLERPATHGSYETRLLAYARGGFRGGFQSDRDDCQQSEWKRYSARGVLQRISSYCYISGIRKGFLDSTHEVFL